MTSSLLLEAWRFRPAIDWVGTEVPKRKWLIKDLLRGPGSIVVVSGQMKRAQKSMFACALASVVSGGRHSARGLPQATIKGPSMILLAEGDETESKIRQAAIWRGLGWQSRTQWPADMHVCYYPGGYKLNDGTSSARLLGEVARVKPVLVVLDSWTYLIAGDENATAWVQPAIDTLQQIQRMGATVLVIVHLSKGAGEDASADVDAQLRGSGLIGNIFDDHHALRRYANDTGASTPLLIRSRFAAERRYSVAWDLIEDDDEILHEARISLVETVGTAADLRRYRDALEVGATYTSDELRAAWRVRREIAKKLRDKMLEAGYIQEKEEGVYMRMVKKRKEKGEAHDSGE